MTITFGMNFCLWISIVYYYQVQHPIALFLIPNWFTPQLRARRHFTKFSNWLIYLYASIFAGAGRAFVYRIAWIRVKMAIIIVRIVDHISARTHHKQSMSKQKYEIGLGPCNNWSKQGNLSFDLVLNSIYPLTVNAANFRWKCAQHNPVIIIFIANDCVYIYMNLFVFNLPP